MLLTLLATTSDIDYFQLLLLSQFDATQGLFVSQLMPTVDILGNIQNAWMDFLQTGKAGALTVGLVMGYMIRGITR